MYNSGLLFKKKGREVKAAIASRVEALQSRLDNRNRTLDHFISDASKLRSYLIFSVERRYGMHEGSGELRNANEISSEEIEDINQLCRRIREIEAELYKLKLVAKHIEDKSEHELSLAELIEYGFSVEGE